MLKVISRSFIGIAVMVCAGLGHAAPSYWTVTPAFIHSGGANNPGDAGAPGQPGQPGQPPVSPEQPGTPSQPPGISFNPGPGGTLLPDAYTGDPYEFDFTTITTITGGSGSLDDVVFTLGGGALPGGMLLTSTGRLEGTPTLGTPPTGQTFTLIGTYQDMSTQQQFTIKVGKQYLKAIAVSGGIGHTCAITPQGALKCWGSNWDGQLGDGTDDDRRTPIQVPGMASGVTQVSAGGDSTCAIQNGSVKCWGGGVFTPTTVPGLPTGIAKVVPGSGGTMKCAITNTGNLYCWGYSAWDFDPKNNKPIWSTKTTPQAIDGGVTDVDPGSSTVCYVKSGSLVCWGENTYSNLGFLSSPYSEVALTQKVTPPGMGSGVTAVATTGMSTCAVQNGGVKCWGNHQIKYSQSPEAIPGLASGVTALSTSGQHACVIQDGAPKCWGSTNDFGELGIGRGPDGYPKDGTTPSPVVGLATGVSQISAGENHTCAVHNGIAKCWGFNDGWQLGNPALGYSDWSEEPTGVTP